MSHLLFKLPLLDGGGGGGGGLEIHLEGHDVIEFAGQ